MARSSANVLSQAQGQALAVASRVVPLVLAAWLCGSESVWAQFIRQGEKLVGDGAVGAAGQGTSVALSADGNTAIVGGAPSCTSPIVVTSCGAGLLGGDGAAWVFTRNNGKWAQQGEKLIGAGALGPAGQGTSVAISADGNTAIVGGPTDNSSEWLIPSSNRELLDSLGAAWIFTRTNGEWTQQGEKLIGTGVRARKWPRPGGVILTIGPLVPNSSSQGISVALSADGNTALVGGVDDSGNGTAWLFTRTGGTWAQEGQRLVVAGGGLGRGNSVALSADGSTAILSSLRTIAPPYHCGPAAWVFVRSDGKWNPQGEKLVGTGDELCFPYSVALSASGDTAILAGFQGISTFIRRNEVWSQQGEKVAVEGFVKGVSISSDGSTFVVGVDGPQRAAAVFARRDGVWVQEGGKLVGRGGLGYGVSVALSGDGTTALLGESEDDDPIGGAWVFIRNSADSK